MAMKIGAARVSTDEQNLSLQRDALEAAGGAVIYHDERIRCITIERDGLAQALSTLKGRSCSPLRSPQEKERLTVLRYTSRVLGLRMVTVKNSVKRQAMRSPAATRDGSVCGTAITAVELMVCSVVIVPRPLLPGLALHNGLYVTSFQTNDKSTIVTFRIKWR